MSATWIVIADANRARIFEVRQDAHLNELDDLVNPAARAKTSELRTDGAGRYFGKGERQQGHTAGPRVDPVEHENDMFAKRLSDYLEHARTAHRFATLHLIAAPKFLGLIRQNLSDSTARLVAEQLPKGLAQLNEHDIEKYIKDKGLL